MAAEAAVAPIVEARRGRSGSVEGLRAVAAGLVLVYHLTRVLGYTDPGIIPSGIVYWIERLGPFGVGVFFVLSGFLLYRPFVDAAFRDGALLDGGAPNLGRYYLRRFTRIFPAYWLALAVYLFVVGPDQIDTIGDGAVYFGLVQNYQTGNLLRGLGVAWTLVIEVSFYLVLPLLAWMFRRKGAASPATVLRRQLVGLALMYGAGVAVRIWALWYRPTGLGRIDAWQPHVLPELWLPGYLDWFALGMLLAVVASWWKAVGGPRGPLRFLADHPGASWFMTGYLYWMTQQMNFPTVVGMQWTPTQSMTRSTLLPLAAAFLVAPIALAPDGKGLIRRVLGSRPAVAIGTISYGIYLWHLIAIQQTRDWIIDGTIPRSVVIQALLVLAMTGAAATVSYLAVEAPLMRWSAKVGRVREESQSTGAGTVTGGSST